MVSTPIRDEVCPATHLRLAGLGVGLQGEEGGPVVDFGECEAGGGYGSGASTC